MGRLLDGRVLATLLALSWLGAVGHAQDNVAVRVNAAAAAAAGVQPGEKGTGAIAGRVLDAGTGQPIAGATVRVIRPPSGSTPVLVEPGAIAGPGESAFTNSSGAYLLRELPKGAYNVMVQAPGYINGQHGQLHPNGPSRLVAVEDGERVLTADVRLWRPGAITGTVVDEAGEPMVGTEVRALRRTFVAGRQVLSAAGSTQSDDRGAYRLGTLTPGDYLVAVPAGSATLPAASVDDYMDAVRSGRSEVASALTREITLGSAGAIGSLGAPGVRLGEHTLQLRSLNAPTGPDPNLAGQVLAYRTGFHPAGSLSPEGAALTVASGEERSGVDIHLELTPTARVSGTVIGADGPVPNMALRLLPAGIDRVASDGGLDVATTVTGTDGRFTFLGVPAGDYVLRALRIPRNAVTAGAPMTIINMGGGGTVAYMSSAGGPPLPPTAPDEPTLWAEMPLSVSAANVENVTVTLRSGLRVSGEVVFDGAAPAPTPDQLLRASIMLRPADGQTGPSPLPGRLDAENRFVTAEYRPGRYLLSMSAPPPWTIKSILVGGRDLTGDAIELADTDLENVVITFTDRPASLSGTVRGSGANRSDGATVAVFPADVRGWIARGMASVRRYTAVAGANGSFTVPNVFPGQYLAVAIDPDRHVDLDDPSVYDALVRAATPVRITDGAQANVTLSLASQR